MKQNAKQKCCHQSRKTIKTNLKAVERGGRHLSFFNFDLRSGFMHCIQTRT